MTISLRRWLPLVMFWGISASPAAGQAPYSGIVMFGTSLSDTGNAFALRAELYGEQNTPPINTPAAFFYGDALLIPSAPYARGGLQLGNGAPWVVPLARQLGLLRSVQPAFASSSPATNYAIDRARARNDGVNLNLADQYAEFDRDFGGILPSDALYVIEMGSNDIDDALRALQAGNPPVAAVILQQAVSSIAQTLQALYAAGARHFLILNAPNLARTPAVITLGPQAQQAAMLLSNTFNTLLNGVVSSLPSDSHVVQLDIYGIVEDIVANADDYGFTDWTHACITPDVPPYTCQDPDEYVFWDGIHPTKAVHAIVAEQAYEALGL